MAEKKSSRSHPQEVVSRFWNKFHHKSPGKVTSIFPRELYKDLDPDFVPSSATRVRNAAQSYQIARTKCIDMVEAAVAHCESTNSRFCDPDFDIESDFFWKDDNCLLGLARCNCAEENKKPNENGDSPGDENDGSGAGYSRCNGMPARSMGVSACASKVRPQSVHPIPWIFDSPQFTVGGFSGSDIKQGILGDCWWLVGVGNIAHRKDLMEKICVARDEECGVYGFVFFKDGEWIPTIVDDSLYLHTEDFGATYEEHDSNGKKAKKWKQNYQTGSEALFCAKCVDENETWLPLLEKAYAKIHGDYEAIEGGWSGDAVEDLTGGITTTLMSGRVLRKEKLWRELLGAGSEVGEFVFGLAASRDSEASSKNGLALNHAYAVVRAVELEDENGKKVKLLKIRNPWGQSANPGLGEWHGPWSDGSREWTPAMMQKLDHEFGDDGLFWMTLEDTLKNFKWIHRTRLFDERWTVAQQWTSTPVSWIPGYLKSKFVVEIKEDGLAVLVLSKLDDRYFTGLAGQYMFNLEFLVRDASSKTKIAEARVGMSNPDARSITCEVRLKPGTYEVIPKVTALEVDDTKKVEDAVKEYVKSNPMKLQQMGMLYDLSHAKVGVLDEDDALLKKRDIDRQKQKENLKDEKINDMKQAMEKMQLAMAEMQLELSKNGKSRGEGKDKIEGKEKKKESTPKEQSGADGYSAEQRPVSDGPTPGHAQITSTPHTTNEIPGPGEGASSADGKVEETAAEVGEQGAGKETGAADANRAANEGEQTNGAEVSGGDGGLEEHQIPEENDDDEEEGPESPWNPVCVMCLSVYAQDKGVSVKLADTTA